MTAGDYADLLDRRGFLALAGGAGATAIAGAGAGTASGQSESETPPQVYDVRHRSLTVEVSEWIQWNLRNAQFAPYYSSHLLFEKLAQWRYEDGAFAPAGLSDWRHTEDAFEMTIRDGLTWSNGRPVGARDLVLQLELARHAGDSMWEWAESVEAVDDATVRIGKTDPIDPRLVENDVLDRFLFADRTTYGPILEDLEDGADVEAYVSFEDVDPITNGPFTLDRRERDALVFSRNPDSPWAENVNFDGYRLESTTSRSADRSALESLLVDSAFDQSTSTTFVEENADAMRPVTVPDGFGLGLIPDHDDPIAGDRAVRRAIQHLVDRTAAIPDSVGAAREVPPVPTGLSSTVQERWLGDEMGTFDAYGADASQTDEAASVLQTAGYERVDGAWQTPEGDPLSIRILHPPGWSDFTIALETIAQDLRAFGVGIDLETPATRAGGETGMEEFNRLALDGEFQFLAYTWLQSPKETTEPYYTLRHQLVGENGFFRDGYPPAVEDRGGSEATVTVPATDGEGDLTVRPADRIDELRRTADEATRTAIVRELAWVANQDLPQIPIFEHFQQQWLTTNDWTVPEDLAADPDANVRWAPTWLARKGKLGYGGRTPQTVEIVASRPIRRGETETLDLEMGSAPEGIDGATIEASLADPSVAEITDATVDEALAGSAAIADDGGAVTFDLADPDDAVGRSVAPDLGELTVAGRSAGETAVAVTVRSFTTDSGDAVRTETRGATITVEPTEVAAIDGEVPGDLDGDGLHEDLNANGRADIADAVELFRHRDDEAVTDHASAYDFNDGGGVSIGDAVALFRENTS